MPTDNHSLDDNYADGDSWDYNDEMATIEERLVVRDIESNRSDYTPHEDAIFIATDTGRVYDGTGSQWDPAIRRHNVVDSGTIELVSGTIVVSTGITNSYKRLSVHLDPSGGGTNSANVKCSARAFWDNAAGEYKVEILEDGTSVGNPTIGYEIEAR